MDVAAMATEILLNLVAIPSVNPSYRVQGRVEDHYGEARIAQFVAEYMEQMGFEVTTQAVEDDRPNVIVRFPGTDSSCRLLLETHLDTVDIGTMSIDPFHPTVRDGKVWGRGACDAKGSLAAMMAAMLLLKRQNVTPPVDVYLVAVVDEEWSFRGVSTLIDSGFRANGAIVGEPTNLDLVIAQKGTVRLCIETRGSPCHSSQPEKGTNAISLMARLICHLEGELKMLYQGRNHALLGAPTLSVTVIRGGIGINIVPDRCEIAIDLRTIPGQTSDAVISEVKEVVARATEGWEGGCAIVHAPFLVDTPMEMDSSQTIVRCLRAAAKNHRVTGFLKGVPCGTDANKLVSAGIPAVVFGPGRLEEAHSDRESVAIDQVAAAVEILSEAIASFRA